MQDCSDMLGRPGDLCGWDAGISGERDGRGLGLGRTSLLPFLNLSSCCFVFSRILRLIVDF